MSLISRMRKQNAVYWPLEGTESAGDDFNDYGEPQHSDPIQILCRWEDVSEEVLLPNGMKIVSKAKVYVDRDMVEGEILMLGTTSDITDSVNLKENDGAWEIRGFQKLPNLRATEFLRIAIL